MTVSDDIEPVGSTAEAPSERTAVWHDDPTTFRHRAFERLATLTRGRIRSPHYRSVERLYRERDASENEECRPASHQRVRTWTLWATEAYTPAHSRRLLSALAALRPTQIGDDRDPAEWVQRQRGRPGSRLYMQFRRSGSLWPLGFDTEMPDFADDCLGTLWSATPSLSMLTMTFFLTDSERGRLEAVLRADHPTRLEPHGASSLGIHSPELERRRVIAETRADWRSQATGWFARTVPGLLTGTPDGVSTCELTVLRGLTPHPEPERRPSDRRDAGLLDALDLRASTVFTQEPPDGSIDGIMTDERGPFFAPRPSNNHALARHSSVSVEEQDFHGGDDPLWGDDEKRHAHRFDQSFRDVPAQFAVSHVVDHFGDRVLASHDALATVIGSTRVGPAIERLRRDTAECADAATVARDIRLAAADGSLVRSDAGLVLRQDRPSDESRRLCRWLRENLELVAGNLARDVADLNATLHAQASLLSAHANLRLQPWIVLLAIVSTLAGIAAAIEPVRELLRSDVRQTSSVATIRRSASWEARIVRPRTDATGGRAKDSDGKIGVAEVRNGRLPPR